MGGVDLIGTILGVRSSGMFSWEACSLTIVPLTPALTGVEGVDKGASGLGPSVTVIDDTRSGGMVGC